MQKEPIVGQKYGMVVIKEDLGVDKQKASRRFVLGVCECGTLKKFSLNSLKKGSTKSCGCLNGKAASDRLTKHGLSRHPIYGIWVGIKKRCYNEKEKAYPDYGGRGIVMCEEWKTDFISFFNWCNENGYKKGLEIDRRENNGNYEPSNCRFVPRLINAKNKRSNVVITYMGETLTLNEWALKSGIGRDTISYRLKQKWPLEKVFSTERF